MLAYSCSKPKVFVKMQYFDYSDSSETVNRKLHKGGRGGGHANADTLHVTKRKIKTKSIESARNEMEGV